MKHPSASVCLIGVIAGAFLIFSPAEAMTRTDDNGCNAILQTELCCDCEVDVACRLSTESGVVSCSNNKCGEDLCIIV